jgi:ribosome maturation factor RimP
VGGRAHFLFPGSAREQEVDAMTQATALQRDVAALAEPLAADAGLDLVDVAVKGASPRQLVRIRVDRKGGVDLAACQRLSQRLSEALDAADVVPGRYALEVTSPGVDYPLTDQRAFDRVEGRPVRVLRQAEDAVREVRGTVRAAEPDGVVLDVDGAPVRIPYAAITKATQTLPW